MTVLVKKPRLTVPESVTKRAGIRPGDLVAFTVRQGTITISAADKFNEKRFPLYRPKKAEKEAIRKGRAAYKRGDFITLDTLRDELDTARHRAGKKITRKAS